MSLSLSVETYCIIISSISMIIIIMIVNILELKWQKYHDPVAAGGGGAATPAGSGEV